MGSRLLRRWLHRPLTDIDALQARHNAIQALCNNYYYETVRESLKPIGDMERRNCFISRTIAGVVPQHPPMIRAPAWASLRAYSAMYSGLQR